MSTRLFYVGVFLVCMGLGGLLASSAHAATPPPPPKFPCRRWPAPVLCEIHANVTRTNQLRRRMGLPVLRYGWAAERYPARRVRILAYWIRVRRQTEAQYAA